ncbi:hypothetical protein CDL12_15691 [Handroanthus impetiginosus]|uniref:Uncharacterized protein n=1 Tax=Handroanthus impetiginosus TaxID=429701 RepID=A0A2G9H2G6_9LAMI|nr:hypothetical protein CDL12_15691 [Handroanthus impetiginosus]
MVSRVEEAMKERQQETAKGKESYQQQLQKQIVQCNKGKTSKFKRSTSNLEEDGLSAAIFLLACIACSPSN